MFVLMMVYLSDSAVVEMLEKLMEFASPLTEIIIPLLTCMLLMSVFKSAYATSSSKNAGGIQIIRATFSTVGKTIGEILMKVELFFERPILKFFKKLRKFFNKKLSFKVSEGLATLVLAILLAIII